MLENLHDLLKFPTEHTKDFKQISSKSPQLRTDARALTVSVLMLKAYRSGGTTHHKRLISLQSWEGPDRLSVCSTDSNKSSTHPPIPPVVDGGYKNHTHSIYLHILLYVSGNTHVRTNTLMEHSQKLLLLTT